MKRKAIFTIGLLGSIVLFFISLSLFGHERKNIKPEDGIYVGKFLDNPMFYTADSGKIKVLGPSFNYKNIIEVDKKSFFALLSEKYSENYIYCQKIPITKNDYSQALIGSDKEFVGLHCGPILGDPDFQVGILIIIKDLPDEKFQIKLFTLEEELIYETTGKVCQVKKPIPHRRLSFMVNGEINSFKNELWEITLNPITNYEWKGIFNVYIDGIWRFEIEVIDN